MTSVSARLAQAIGGLSPQYLADGSMIDERQPHQRGGAQQKLGRDEIEAKFFANAAYGGWTRPQAERARDLARRLFDGPLELRALRG